MLEILLPIFIAFPSLLILTAYSIKGIFIDDYNPYDKLKDIDCIEALRNENGKGIKRFLAAIEYERMRKGLLLIVDGRNLFLVFGLYIIGILSIANTIGFTKLNPINAVIGILPTLVAVIIAIIAFQILSLKKKIGD